SLAHAITTSQREPQEFCGLARDLPRETRRARVGLSGYTFRVHRESGHVTTTRTRAAHRTMSGARLATLSVVAGAVATAASLTAVAYVAAVGSAATAHESESIRLASHASAPRSVHLPHDDGFVRAVRETQVGGILLVDVGAEVVSLDDELDRQRAIAARSEQRLVLWLVVDDCKPCKAVEAALASPEVQ